VRPCWAQGIRNLERNENMKIIDQSWEMMNIPESALEHIERAGRTWSGNAYFAAERL